MLDSVDSSPAVRDTLRGFPWRTDFSEITIQRGRAYAARERALVTSVSVTDEGWEVAGRVRGSRSTPYLTTLYVPFGGRGEDLATSCSCPMGAGCKHAVALIETLLAETGPAVGKPGPVPSKGGEAAAASVPSSLPTDLRHWIDVSLGEGEGGRSGVPHADGDRRVRYSFHLGASAVKERGGVARLTLLAFPVSGKDRTTGQRALERGVGRGSYPAWLSEVDVRLVQEMESLSNTKLEGTFGAAGMVPRGRFWSLLTDDILATGRAIWGGDAEALLQNGPPRELEPHWIAESAGGRLLTAVRFLDSQKPAVVLGTTPLRYLDPESLTVGAAVWQQKVDAVQWMSAPAVEPAQMGRVSERMASVGWTPALRPVELKIRDLDVEEAPLVLRLVLTRLKVKLRSHPGYFGAWPTTSVTRELPVALFQARYGSLMVSNPVDDAGAILTEVTASEILRVTRNLERESGYASLFQAAGLKPVTEVVHLDPRDHRVPGNAFTLAQQASLPERDADAWYAFQGVVPKLREMGWEVEVRPDFGMELTEVDDLWTDLEAEGQEDWFRFDVGIQVAGQRISLLPVLREIAGLYDFQKDLAKLLEAREEDTVPIKLPDHGMVVGFPAKRLGQLLLSLLQLFEPTSGEGATVHKLGAARLAWLLPDLEGETAKRLRQLGERLADFKGVTRVKAPRSLKAALRGYQVDGLSWLQFLRTHGLGGILADDMGLGKTVQTLAHLLVEKKEGRLDRPCLIVAPTSVVGNWAAEAARFAPGLRVLVSQGADRQAGFERIPQHDLVITSYALLPRDEEVIGSHQYHYVILDEAQYIKNPVSKMAQAARALQTRHRLCLTGTPMENHLGELWSLFAFLMPGFLGDQDSFRKNWRKPIESGEDGQRREVLAKRVAPLMLRRTRGQVLEELPPRTDIVRSVALSRPQTELYEVVRAAMDKRVREAIRAKGLAQSQIVVLDALLKLRQICCDPRLLKLPAARKVKESAKLESFRELVTGLVAEGRRILVFSQFTSMLELLEACLAKEKIPSIKLTGDTPGNERTELVDAFQAGKAPVFFISLKAGGSGLNLTTADTVIHYDPWWNPAVEEQATGRAHRMGQMNPVFVYRLITEGTIEERILQLQTRKAAIAAAILEGQSGEPGQGLAIERADLEMLLAPL
ncbi:MAG: DEAD/DEAH box helicase [Verrucomicrobia bacterium]|nr:DEAD/DEAH box helicase [Verrucomicrobiota bacterium]